jgi:hypothetical protein
MLLINIAMEEIPMRTLNSKKLIFIASMFITLAWSLPLMAGSQVIKLLPQEVSVAPGERTEIVMVYDVMQGKSQTAGLALRVHYDSRVIESITFEDNYGDGLVGVGTVVQNSIKSMGADPAADKFLSIAWLDVVGNWPSFLPLPLNLSKIVIKVKPNIDMKNTIIDVSAIEGPSGYTFQGTPCYIRIK